ncbi:hypothetical protein IG631_03054 [Alternaria alternata]|jgi:hypothetical protein|nr:hypothetical protein IG631_03054 [Alternaria alternata]
MTVYSHIHFGNARYVLLHDHGQSRFATCSGRCMYAKPKHELTWCAQILVYNTLFYDIKCGITWPAQRLFEASGATDANELTLCAHLLYGTACSAQIVRADIHSLVTKAFRFSKAE